MSKVTASDVYVILETLYDHPSDRWDKGDRFIRRIGDFNARSDQYDIISWHIGKDAALLEMTMLDEDDD
jgi:hypothetical protein